MCKNHSKTAIFLLTLICCAQIGCKQGKKTKSPFMLEQQLTFNAKTHALDNNDNFSPDAKYLCYDTRNMVFNSNLANSKAIEKVEIATGRETILWQPASVSGENAAPGVAAVSYHPTENKVVFNSWPPIEGSRSKRVLRYKK